MTKTTYRVTAPVGYMGYLPGDTFDADLDEGEEKRAIKAGWIEPADRTSKKGKEGDGA